MPPGNKTYIILNGHFYDAGKPVLSFDNRAFKFGDGLFETMRCHRTVPLFFHHHYNRLLRGMAILQLSVASLPSMADFLEQIEKLIVRNRIFYDARVRLSVFRRGGALYTPEDNSVAWLLEATPLEEKGYTLNEQGMRIGIYSGFPKIWSPLSPFKTLYTSPNILAGLFKKENYWDDCLIENDEKKIIEAISSNLFWVNGETLYTPSVTTGCVDGVMRSQVLRYAVENKLKVHENTGAGKDILLQADEIFLTNAVKGIRWVVALDNKRYFNRMPKKIVAWLNSQIS